MLMYLILFYHLFFFGYLPEQDSRQLKLKIMNELVFLSLVLHLPVFFFNTDNEIFQFVMSIIFVLLILIVTCINITISTRKLIFLVRRSKTLVGLKNSIWKKWDGFVTYYFRAMPGAMRRASVAMRRASFKMIGKEYKEGDIAAAISVMDISNVEKDKHAYPSVTDIEE